MLDDDIDKAIEKAKADADFHQELMTPILKRVIMGAHQPSLAL